MDRTKLIDLSIRGVIVLLFGARFLYWHFTEIRADKTKPMAQPIKSKKRIFTIVLALVVSLQVLGVQIWPFETEVWVQLVGLVVVALGFWVCMEARRTIGVNWTHAVDYQIKRDHELVTGSVYRYIRHPIYAGIVAMVLGAELVVGSYLGLAMLLAAIPIMSRQVAREEKLLSRHFGQKYVDYMKTTKRFVPWVW